jgi:hypothetical protein
MSTQWKWYFSNSGEFYHGEFDSRSEAIATGWAYYQGRGHLMVCEAIHNEPTCDVFEADWVLEMFDEKNEESWGENGEPYSDLKFSSEAKRQLEVHLKDVLHRWMDENKGLRSWSFGLIRNEIEINMDAATTFDDIELEGSIAALMLVAFQDDECPSTIVVDMILNNWERLSDKRQESIQEAVSNIITSLKDGYYKQQWQKVLDK